MRRVLTAEETEWLVANFANTPNAELAEHLGIGLTSVWRLAKPLGLTKSAEYLRLQNKIKNKKAIRALQAKGWPPRGYIIPRSQGAGFKKGQTNEERLGAEADADRRRKARESCWARWKSERLRVSWGMERRTNVAFKFCKDRKKNVRCQMRKRGYEIARGANEAHVTADTRRSEYLEWWAGTLGITTIEQLCQ